MWKKLPSVTGALIVLLRIASIGTAAPADGAEKLTLDFADPAWKLDGDAKIDTHLGHQALRIRSGSATREDVVFQDGTLEFDLAPTRHRAFVYVKFRMTATGENEEIYFRTHKSELPDAIQYAPVYKNVANWQLYHGPGYTAAATLPPATWVHIKLIVKGRQGAVFVEDMENPRMIIPLAREPRPGAIGLRAFLPQGAAPDEVFTGNFANVSVRPGEVGFTFPELEAPTPPPGVVESWQVSQTFPSGRDVRHDTLPPDIAQAAWRTLPAEPSGLVVLDRYLTRPEGSRFAAVAARLTIDAAQAERRRFDFGYSDRVSVFLNGELLAEGEASYSFNFPRRQGLIGLDQGTLYLPLVKGRNELLLIVSDVFGGWGLMGALADAEVP